MATTLRTICMWSFAACVLELTSSCAQITRDQMLSKPERLEDCADCGVDRTYYIHAGTGDNQAVQPKDLVLVLHGFRSSAKGTITRTNSAFEELAESGSMIVVHAQALGPNWVFGDGASSGQSYDKAYFDAIWRDVRNTYSSLERIHLVGLSRGAMAAYFLACEGELPIASLTALAMPMPEFSEHNCPNAAPLDFILANGDADDLVPYDGGDIDVPWFARPGDRDFGSILSTEETLALWRVRNGCDDDLTTSSRLDNVRDGTSVHFRSWENCTGGEVRHYSVLGGGHRWLNELWDPLAWVLLGATTREVSTAPRESVE